MVVHALANASKGDKERLISILEANNEDLVEDAIAIFNKYGSIEYTRNIALHNVKTAKELLNVLEDSDAKESLELIADFVLERTH
jgi:geranylgeranyl diphosphate synthase type I